MRRTAASLPAALAAAALLAACTSSGGGDGGATAPGTAGRSAATSAPGSTAGSTSSTASAGSVADWPTYHRTLDRTGVATGMPKATGTLTALVRAKLDGAVYASPIVVGGRAIVATEHDVVYAFDRTYHQVWKRKLGSPSPAEERQCGDITPLGITGTPVYDATTKLVYLVTELSGTVRHQLVALDPATGTPRWSRTVDLPGVSARDMQQRGALSVAGGRVWVPFGAQAGDCGDYKGRLVGVRLDGRGAPVSYSPPTKRGGGMWNPAGPTLGRDGKLLAVSANGAAFPGDAYDHTNSVLRLDADAKLLDAFAPSDWAVNNRDDVGLGSQAPVPVGTKWLVLGGKSGPVYVLRQDRLGGIGGQVSVKDICKSFGGAAVSGSTVYLPCTDGVRAVRVDGAGTLHVLWHAKESINGSPIVGGGRVWVLDYDAGVLHALDPATGRSAAQVGVGVANRFATPAAAGADVLVPTLAGLSVVRTS